jgi:hypothetical protein
MVERTSPGGIHRNHGQGADLLPLPQSQEYNFRRHKYGREAHMARTTNADLQNLQQEIAVVKSEVHLTKYCPANEDQPRAI